MFKRILATMLVATGGLCSIPAHAATTTWVVDTLAHGAPDTNVGDGICQTAAGECSLRAALEEANALPELAGDDVRIVFADGLSGDIEPVSSSDLMRTGALGSTAINDYLGQGAFYHVNSPRPVTIDFGNRIGVVQQNDSEYAAFYIESNNVVIENFQNAARRDITAGTFGGYNDSSGVTSGGSAFVVGGANITIRNGQSSQPSVDTLEACVSLIDGASNVRIENYYCRRSGLFALYVDERATVSNIVLDHFETDGGLRYGDIWVEYGAGGDAGQKTTVNGLTITDSEFRSSAVNYTIGLRENSIINDLKITGSRFLGTNTRSIYAYPTATLGAVTINNNTATGTAFFFETTTNVTHTGPLNISNNVLTSNLYDVIFLQSPLSGAVIENNKFLNQRSLGSVAGVRISTAAFGANNVIRGNLFDQGADEGANRYAIWMRANSGRDEPTGWSITNNVVKNILGGTSPIYNDGDGNTLISGNTFGEGTRGAGVGITTPENNNSYFVVNADVYSNGKIQTWRPTGAVYSGTSITVQVSPVSPLLPGNSAPALPVSIDVYCTASDKAETYLGRIPGTFSA